MEKISIKEFKDKSNIEIIKELMKINEGYITTKLITELGIHRTYLKLMEEKNIIKKVATGIYVSTNKEDIDYYYVFSLRHPKAIFSHLTALYLHGIYPKENAKYDIAVPHKYHNTNNNIHNVYYLTAKYYNLGISEVKTPMDNMVKAYDVNKALCDIIRFKTDEKIIKKCMQEYIKKYNNLDDLLHYAEISNIKPQVMRYYKEAGGIIKE